VKSFSRVRGIEDEGIEQYEERRRVLRVTGSQSRGEREEAKEARFVRVNGVQIALWMFMFRS
jgi:hypothetical protein